MVDAVQPAPAAVSRRSLLIAGLAAAAPLAGCSSTGSSSAGSPAASPAAASATGSSSIGGSGSAGSPDAAATSSAGTGQGASAAGSAAASGSPTSSVAAGAVHAAGPDITHGPRIGSAVALTFHGAGDGAILRRMLAILAAADAHVTVLAIGQWLAAEPALAKLILDAGHDLGNHTWSHQTMPRLPVARIAPEIDRAAAELRTLTGSAGHWFRPSGTPVSTPAIRAAAVRAGYGACLGYDVDPLDYTDPGAAAIERNVAAAVRPGSIVSLHLGHQETLAAMPHILDTLKAKGLRAVTATTLLGGS